MAHLAGGVLTNSVNLSNPLPLLHCSYILFTLDSTHGIDSDHSFKLFWVLILTVIPTSWLNNTANTIAWKWKIQFWLRLHVHASWYCSCRDIFGLVIQGMKQPDESGVWNSCKQESRSNMKTRQYVSKWSESAHCTSEVGVVELQQACSCPSSICWSV